MEHDAPDDTTHCLVCHKQVNFDSFQDHLGLVHDGRVLRKEIEDDDS